MALFTFVLWNMIAFASKFLITLIFAIPAGFGLGIGVNLAKSFIKNFKARKTMEEINNEISKSIYPEPCID